MVEVHHCILTLLSPTLAWVQCCFSRILKLERQLSTTDHKTQLPALSTTLCFYFFYTSTNTFVVFRDTVFLSFFFFFANFLNVFLLRKSFVIQVGSLLKISSKLELFWFLCQVIDSVCSPLAFSKLFNILLIKNHLIFNFFC